MKSKKSLIFICLVGILFGMSGCILTPAIDSVQRAGVTESGRRGILPESLREFHANLFWGSMNEAVLQVAEENRVELQDKLLKSKKVGRVVDSKVEFVKFSEDAFEADVDVSTRFHNYATNTIESRNQKERWRFTLMEGWKVTDLESEPAENA